MKSRIAILCLLATAGAAAADTSSRKISLEPKRVGLVRTIPIGAIPNAISLSPDGRRVAINCADGPIRVYETSSWKMIASRDGYRQMSWRIGFSPDGKRLAVGDSEGRIHLLDASTLAETGELSGGHSGLVYAVAWSPDGSRLASASQDQTARIWDAGGRELATLRGHSSQILDVSWSRDGRLLATAGAEGAARIWDAATGRQMRLLSAPPGDSLLSAALSGNGKRLVTGSHSGCLRLWDGDTGREIWNSQLFMEGSGVRGLAFAPDERHIICSMGTRLIFVEAATGKTVTELQHHSADIQGLAVARDARCVVTLAHDFQLKVWKPVPGGMAGVRPKGFLGVGVALDNDLVRINEVHPDTAAQRAGLRAGDFLLGVGGVPTPTVADAIGQIGSYFEGDEIELQIRRGAEELRVRARLGLRPENLKR